MQTLGDNKTENKELEDSDDEEHTDEGQKEQATTALAPSPCTSTPMACRVAFEIDPNINIDSRALLDMISETEVVSVTASEKGTGHPGPSKPANLETKISVAEAFDNW